MDVPQPVLSSSEILSHAGTRVLVLWKAQLAGAIVIAIGTFLAGWIASGFSEGVLDQVTTVAIYPTVAVMAWLVASALWHVWRAPVRLAREREATHAQRVSQLERERDEARAALADDDSRGAVARRLEGFIREYAQLRAEVPDEQTGVGPVVTEDQEAWNWSANHLGERVSSELRQNMPGFVAYWRTNPEPRLYFQPFGPWAKQLVDMSIKQLRHIAARLRGGYDEP